MSVTVRSIQESDAEPFIALRRQIFGETKFMLIEPDEVRLSVDEQRSRIKSILSCSNSHIFIAEDEGKLVGFLYAGGGEFRRSAHAAHIALGVLAEFHSQGIGTQLFAALERWAKQARITRLELTVMPHNPRAIHLYEKVGFTVEGKKRNSLRVENLYVDEILMSKLLPPG